MIKDLIGQRFGKLTVKSKAHSFSDHAYWICACDCGKNTIVRGTNLTTLSIKSCGCFKRESARTRARAKFGFRSTTKRRRDDP